MKGMAASPNSTKGSTNAANCMWGKYFVSNGPPSTPRRELLRVGFSRFAVERCFEDDKTEIGLDHFEVRNYSSVKRHLMVSAMSLMFLAEIHQEDRGEKSGTDGLPGPHGRQCDHHEPTDERNIAAAVFGEKGIDHQSPAETKHDGKKMSPQGNNASITRRRIQDCPH